MSVDIDSILQSTQHAIEETERHRHTATADQKRLDDAFAKVASRTDVPVGGDYAKLAGALASLTTVLSKRGVMFDSLFELCDPRHAFIVGLLKDGNAKSIAKHMTKAETKTPKAFNEALKILVTINGHGNWLHDQLLALAHGFQPKAVDSTSAALATSTPTFSEGLTFKPGGYIYRGVEMRLSGKCLGILTAFCDSRWLTKTAADLADTFWEADDAPQVSVYICKLRKSLQEAMRRANVAEADPLPCVDEGDNLAWELKLP